MIMKFTKHLNQTMVLETLDPQKIEELVEIFEKICM